MIDFLVMILVQLLTTSRVSAQAFGVVTFPVK